MAIDYTKRTNSAADDDGSERMPDEWGELPPWSERNAIRPPMPEPPCGSIVRFRIGKRYNYVAIRVDDAPGTFTWYTTSTQDGEDWGVDMMDSWKHICAKATGEIQIATGWRKL